MKKILGEVVSVAFWILFLSIMGIVTINPVEEWGPKFEKVETFGPIEQQDSIQIKVIK